MTVPNSVLSIPVETFEQWRVAARRLVAAGVSPEQVRWVDWRARQSDGQQDLFAARAQHTDALPSADDTLPSADMANSPASNPVEVLRSFVELATTVAHHRSPLRWELLYQLLWRITHDEKNLLQIASDRDLHQAKQMEKAIRRDIHKMHAFVRFRKTIDADGDRYVAWHRPDHYIVPLAAPFFARRFDVMRWAILTPDESVAWDGQQLVYSPGVPRGEAPSGDELETLWKTYYANIFNPARIKLKAMKAEMPQKHWPTMPETELISTLVRDAPRRVDEMIKRSQNVMTTSAYMPDTSNPTLDQLRSAAHTCKGCELYRDATQTVFGRGPASAKLVFVGEQPGDKEDIAGEPFVGPAGQLFRDALDEVGLDPNEVYMTNAVKHFKFKLSGARRLHVKPSSREISACKPWLESELGIIRPQTLVCLGATAASAILGPQFRITKGRGIVHETVYAKWTLATYHPSALLRTPDADTRQRMRESFVSDLGLAVNRLRNLPTNEQ